MKSLLSMFNRAFLIELLVLCIAVLVFNVILGALSGAFGIRFDTMTTFLITLPLVYAVQFGYRRILRRRAAQEDERRAADINVVASATREDPERY